MVVDKKESLKIQDLFDIKGKNIIVTGGTRGIGYSMSRTFVENGANVIMMSRSSDGGKICEELNSLGPGKSYFFSCNLGIVKDINTVPDQLKKLGFTEIHALINNSGTSWGEDITQYSEEGWDKVMDLNVKGIFFLTKVLLPYLEKSGTHENPSRVINIGSIAGLRHQLIPTYAYDTSKAAVHALSQKLACDLAERHITVNALALGFFPSKMSDQITTYTTRESLLSRIPLARFGSPSDIGGVCLWLLSKAGSFVTGAVIPVDGGDTVNVKPMMFVESKL